MGKVTIRKFSYLDYEIAIIRERTNLPDISPFEPQLGIQVRYGLKFAGQITDWTEFVEATNDEPSANSLAEIGVRRAQAMRKEERATLVSPAA